MRVSGNKTRGETRWYGIDYSAKLIIATSRAVRTLAAGGNVFVNGKEKKKSRPSTFDSLVYANLTLGSGRSERCNGENNGEWRRDMSGRGKGWNKIW